MNLKSQAHKLQSYLTQFTSMWNAEIMNEYPHSLQFYPKDWLDLLDTLSEKEIYEIDSKILISKIDNTSFKEFMTTLAHLSKIPFTQNLPELPLEDWAFNGVKSKKKHEIQKIVPVLKEINDSEGLDHIVDIGGGVGHLSRVLSHYHSIPSISLDINQEFQEIGKQRLTKYRKINGSKDVRFININFTEKDKNNSEILKSIFTKNSLSLGLHTCGGLATALIGATVENSTRGLLSFGCCYHRLRPDAEYPLSSFLKENQFLPLNLYAFTLATRSHAAMSYSDFQTKERVKYFRYALHLFLLQHFNNQVFIDVGECQIKIYWGAFADYVKMKLKFLELEDIYSHEYINQFYQSNLIQTELRKMWLCNIIRWQLGRALEVYLLLDRCIYLEEQGFEVKIEQYFKEVLSPRNIGILALRK